MWAARLVDAGIWHLRPWSLRYPLRSFEDTRRERAEADRAAGRARTRDGAAAQSLAVYAIGSTSGLFGTTAEPPGWLLEDLGDVRWAAELVVDRLTELRVRMRAIGRAVD